MLIEDLEVIAALSHTAAVTQVALRLRPDVVVIDVDLPDSATLTAVHDLRRRVPDTQIVGLIPATPPGLLLRLLAADVHCAIDKNAPAARLLDAIRGVARAHLVIDSHLAVAALAVAPAHRTGTRRPAPSRRRRVRTRDRRTPAPRTPAPCATTCPRY